MDSVDVSMLKGPRRINFDRIAHRYDETRGLPQRQMKPIVDKLYRELAPYRNVLEVGVGTGRFAVPLQRKGVHLLGVDISSRMLARGREKGLRDIALADALALPFRDKCVDAAYSIHLLHLIQDWKGALREISRVTREAYYTVASYWEESESPHRLYWRVVRESGCGQQRPGIFERDLPDIVPPVRRLLVGDFSERIPTADMVKTLEERSFSTQWRLPEEVHERAMKAVTEEFSQGTIALRKRVEVIRWNVDDLPRS